MQQQNIKILIIEDNLDIRLNIADYLQQQGVTLDFADNGELGLRIALTEYYDCIILDLTLPKIDGLLVCQKIRQDLDRHVPIIMMTARDTLMDKREGFGIGADDYLTKPFDLEELWLRCQAIIKRHSVGLEQRLVLGTLHLDRQKKSVARDNTRLNLPPIPFQILCILMQAHPRVVSRTELCDKIWGQDYTESDALRSHVYQLRKILDKPFDKPLLKTAHGIGFSLNIP